jgi:RNA 3'-terminal phosphate cyclase
MPSPILTLSHSTDAHIPARLGLATLTATPIRLTQLIPATTDALVQLLLKLQDGAQLTISNTGTTLTYTPGILTGGKEITLEMDQHLAQGCELAVILLPWCKKKTTLTLTGVTNGKQNTVRKALIGGGNE